MRYKNKHVAVPVDLQVGSEVGVVGEGSDTYIISDIIYQDGKIIDIVLSCGCREPLCKLYLLRGYKHYIAQQDPTSWIYAAIGECDICGIQFSDACTYHSDKTDSMICQKCHKGNGPTHIRI